MSDFHSFMNKEISIVAIFPMYRKHFVKWKFVQSTLARQFCLDESRVLNVEKLSIFDMMLMLLVSFCLCFVNCYCVLKSINMA